MINNDFHPDDQLNNDADHGHWGTKLDIPDARPLAMFGGRSTIEVNNPDLGPSDAELNDRNKSMEIKKRNYSK